MQLVDYDPPGSRDGIYWFLDGFWKVYECWGRMELPLDGRSPPSRVVSGTMPALGVCKAWIDETRKGPN